MHLTSRFQGLREPGAALVAAVDARALAQQVQDLAVPLGIPCLDGTRTPVLPPTDVLAGELLADPEAVHWVQVSWPHESRMRCTRTC